MKQTTAEIKERHAREMALDALTALREAISTYIGRLDYDARRIERESLQELIDEVQKLSDLAQDCVRVLPEQDEDVAEAAE
jgi:inorganic triphosphatase YgiF